MEPTASANHLAGFFNFNLRNIDPIMKQAVLLVITCFLFGCRQDGRFHLTRDNADQLCILLDANPGVAATFAARELQYHIKKSMGVELPVVRGAVPAKMLPLCVGESQFTRQLDLNVAQFDDQEYIIRINRSYVVLAGKDQPPSSGVKNPGNDILFEREKTASLFDYAKANLEAGPEQIYIPAMFELQGTCYAVYDFLERFLGVRWYGPHPDNIVTPGHVSLLLSPVEIKRSMAIKYRGGTGFGRTMNQDLFFNATPEMYQLYDRRMRVGGEKWGSNHSFISFMDRYLTKSKEDSELHEDYRPEFFAVGQDKGERQLCYTNKELIVQVARDAIDYFDGNPPKGKQVAIGDYFALVPHDNANWCQCENCQKLLEKDKDYKQGDHFSSGVASDYLFYFVNEVAKLVKLEHPDKKIAALAYWLYAYFPRDIELEPNVSVAPCLQPRNYWAPKIKENDMFFYKQWIDESRESDRPIFLWNYYCFPTERGDILGFNVFPGFSAHLLDEQIKMYAEDGVEGVFLCGVGEQVDYYITMKLYDDPGQDIDTLLGEFFTKYFGNAAVPMEKFYATIEKRYNDPNSYPEEVRIKDTQFHQDEEQAWKYLGTRAVMEELEGYMTEARESAKTDMEKKRVASWASGIWDYMVKGRQQYLAKQQNTNQ